MRTLLAVLLPLVTRHVASFSLLPARYVNLRDILFMISSIHKSLQSLNIEGCSDLAHLWK